MDAVDDVLDEASIISALAERPAWSREGKLIRRRYKFSTFPKAIEFVNRVAEVAEANQHHPFISIDYKSVTLELVSWHAGGLTELDFRLARLFDEIYA